jgi:hypothetical protein
MDFIKRKEGKMIIVFILSIVSIQTKWEKSGIIGPVDEWSNRFWQSKNINLSVKEEIFLIAGEIDYSRFRKHIVERKIGIADHAQGFMSVDIDNDGILDLVAHTDEEVVWYKHDGSYNFSSPNIIGEARWSHPHLSIYPADLNKDGKVDVLVATSSIGCRWFENTLPGNWEEHIVDATKGYHRVSADDIDRDGDMDIIAVNNSGGNAYGEIEIFKNQGNENFVNIQTLPTAYHAGWRVYTADFNNDEYPDIYSIGSNSNHVYLNNRNGTFSQSFSSDYWSNQDFDGASPFDVDGDGDMDLICGVNIYNTLRAGFYALLNDGTGTNFDTLHLKGTESGGRRYGDGACAYDIDLDGFWDIAGALFGVAYFRQNPNRPLEFSMYRIDNTKYCHWVYFAPLCLKCIPKMDILLTDSGGAHIVYENRTVVRFAENGYLESSLLRINTTFACEAWVVVNACIPKDSLLTISWRASIDSNSILTQPYSSPYYIKAGKDVIDSFSVNITGMKYFQYRADFVGDSQDVAVLKEIKLVYDCQVFVEEKEKKMKEYLKYRKKKVFLTLKEKGVISLKLYDISGREIFSIYEGKLPPGEYKFNLNMGKGIYFLVFKINNKYKESIKITKIK